MVLLVLLEPTFVSCGKSRLGLRTSEPEAIFFSYYIALNKIYCMDYFYFYCHKLFKKNKRNKFKGGSNRYFLFFTRKN